MDPIITDQLLIKSSAFHKH